MTRVHPKRHVQRHVIKLPASGTYTHQQLEQLWVGAGGPPAVASTMAAIALAESSGRTDAENTGYTNEEGKHPAGLWQINLLPFAGNPLNPLTNARMAIAKYRSQGLNAWETYTNGAYQKYQQAGSGAPLPAGSVLSFIGQELENLNPLNPETFLKPEGAVLGTAKEGGRAVSKLLNLSPVELLINGVLLLAGAVLVVYGIMVAVRPRDKALGLPKMPLVVPA